MKQLSAKDMQDAGLLVAKMAASGAEPIAVIVVGLDRKAGELSAGTLFPTHVPLGEVREAIAACATDSILTQEPSSKKDESNRSESPIILQDDCDGCERCAKEGEDCNECPDCNKGGS